MTDLLVRVEAYMKTNAHFVGLLHHPFGFNLMLAFLASLFTFLNYFVWLRITDEGSVPEMRLWSILLIKSDLTMVYLNLSRILFLNIIPSKWENQNHIQFVMNGSDGMF